MEQKTWIDAFKGIAICGVVLVHSASGFDLGDLFGQVARSGARGVQLFFMISAFLTFVSLRKHYDNGEPIVKWFLKKLFIIAPAYYISIFVFMVFVGNPNVTWSNILMHLFFVNGFVPSYINSIGLGEWYIADLMIFYAIAPWLYKRITSIDRAALWFFVSTVVCYFVAVNLSTVISNAPNPMIMNDYVWWASLLMELPVIFLGIFMYYIVENNILKELKGHKGLSFAIGGFSIYYICCLITGPTNLGGSHGIGFIDTLLYSFGFAGLIISQEIYSWKVIVNKVFVFLGRHSFGIYLTHILLIKLYFSFDFIQTKYVSINWLLIYGMILTTAAALAILINRYIQKPCLLLLDRICDSKSRDGYRG